MRLAYAFFARAAELTGTGFSALNADFDQIGVPQVPTSTPPISLVVKLWFGTTELGQHNICVDFAPVRTGEYIAVAQGFLAVSPNPHDQLQESGAGFVMNLSLPINELGAHLLRLFVDGRELTRIPLIASQG
jgi:hypothetical protein